MSILGRPNLRKGAKPNPRITAHQRAGKFAETLRGMGYSHIPVLLTAADVKKLLGRIPNSLVDYTACGEKGFYRARDVEPLWWAQ